MDGLFKSRFDKLLERATNELLIEPDLESTLSICDLIRSQEIPAKTAVTSIKKRLQHDNPHVILHVLYVLESTMKNCGSAVHEEVAKPDFMQALSTLTNGSHDVCTQILTCIQNWAFVFKDKPGFSAIQEAYDELKSEGHNFPPFSENDAMFSVTCAPNWQEGDTCYRCKVAFTTFRRRHHCRNCGNSFCADCSSERTALPKFGIEKEVRVCDHCFEHMSKAPQDKQPKEKKPVNPNRDDQTRLEQERKQRELETLEAEQFELALALSASEAESKERERRVTTQHNTDKRPDANTTSTAPSTTMPTYPNVNAQNGRPLHLLPVLDTTDMDPELARYLNRHYWDNRAEALKQSSNVGAPMVAQGGGVGRTSPMLQPSAPIYCSPAPSMTSSSTPGLPNTPVLKNVEGLLKSGNENNTHTNTGTTGIPGVPELTNPTQEEFLNVLRGSIEFFVNRMQSNSQRGRSIANDTTVQTLFLTLHEMHPQLLQQKQAMEERRAYFEGFQDKLTQLREAREALDALREEHATRRQLEEQEAARLRQLQMMQKLEVMRQQKRDTLEFRRRMALEQTMQYQHQYQTPGGHPGAMLLDPVSGLPIAPRPMVSGYPGQAYVGPPAPGGYPQSGPYHPIPVAGYHPGIGSMHSQQPLANEPVAYGGVEGGAFSPYQYGPGPGQPLPNYATYPAYPTAGVAQDPSLYGGGQRPEAGGAYSMQQLDASLPPPGSGITYPMREQAPPGMDISNDPNRFRAGYTELAGEGSTEHNNPSPGPNVQPATSQMPATLKTDGQLIMFD